MNPSRTCSLAALLLLGVTTQLRAAFLSVVEVTDLRGNATFQICTDEEKKTIEAELKAEAKAYPKALEETKADWKVFHKDTPFPGGGIKVRALRVLTTTPNRDEADTYLAKKESRSENAIAEDKREQERILNLKPSRSRNGRNNAAQVAKQQAAVKKDRERAANADKAEVMLRKKLAAAAGHEIPFYGETPVEQQPKAAAKKKKK